MEGLIPVVNRVQAAFGAVGMPWAVDFPQIAVVGAQSVGKSSVLEAIVGRDFLPRGQGIVTRRPLILQLCHSRGQSEVAEFGHLSGEKFEDFRLVREEIERETERVVGANKGISAHPITLKITSPHVVDLTVIDLPGITKVPVGDQPPDIEVQIRRMIFDFISKPSCIILAVTAANTDIANSDSLKLAREADAEGARTIGVITKVDAMEDGTDALDALMGRIYPLRRGYIGVVCRNQKQVIEEVEVRESLQLEQDFFDNSPIYRTIAHRCGIRHLCKTLNQMLIHHIHDTLPDLKMRLGQMQRENEQLLIDLGDPISDAKGNRGAVLLHFFTKFARNFQDTIDGRVIPDAQEVQLSGGARINYIFHDWFGRTIAEFDPLSGLTDYEIRTAIRNATGPRAALFVPEAAFDILVKKQIKKLEHPCTQCVEQVYEELQKVVETCELPEMTRFYVLREKILDVVKSVLRRCLVPTSQMIHNLIQVELGYINTNHPDFLNKSAIPEMFGDSKRESGGHPHDGKPPNELSAFQQAVAKQKASLFVKKRPIGEEDDEGNSTAPSFTDIRLPVMPDILHPTKEPCEREQIEAELIKSLIKTYFNIVRKNIADAVPKSIMYFMVNTAKDVLQRELVTQLYKEDLFNDLLKEPGDISQRRRRCKDLLKSVRNAQEILNQVKEFNLDLPTA